jgi:hypothetical protein
MDSSLIPNLNQEITTSKEITPEKKEKKTKQKQMRKTDNIGLHLDKRPTKDLSIIEDLKGLFGIEDVSRKGTSYTPDTAPLSPDAEIDFKLLDQKLLTDVQEANFWNFCETFMLKRTSWGKKIPNEKILSFSKSIDKPITHVSKNFHEIADQTFKNILSYCGDRGSSKVGVAHARKLLKYGMEQSAELRDEIYMQIIKQTRNNPNEPKLLKVWKLFAIVASVVPPSGTLYHPLLGFLMETATTEADSKITKEIKAYAKYCFKRVNRIYDDEARKREPTVDEIMFVEQRRQFMIPIYFLTGLRTFAAIESYSTSQEIKESIIRKLKIDKTKIPYLGLYEVCDKKDTREERFIEGPERIADVLAQWDTEKKANKDIKYDFKMYLRLRVFPKLNEEDIDNVVFYYTHIVYEVVNGRYTATDVDIINLAAYQLQVDYGDYDGKSKVLDTKLASYLPCNKINDHPPNFWKEKIYPAWERKKGLERNQARYEYSQICRQFPLFLSYQYNARFTPRAEAITSVTYPETVLIAVSPDSLIIVDEKTKNVIVKYALEKIMTWGISTEFFVVVTGDQNYQEKAYFETNHARQIDYLLQCYAKMALRLPIPTSLTPVTKVQGAKPKVLGRNCVSFSKI